LGELTTLVLAVTAQRKDPISKSFGDLCGLCVSILGFDSDALERLAPALNQMIIEILLKIRVGSRFFCAVCSTSGIGYLGHDTDQNPTTPLVPSDQKGSQKKI
jgi:hypothetical protein